MSCACLNNQMLAQLLGATLKLLFSMMERDQLQLQYHAFPFDDDIPDKCNVMWSLCFYEVIHFFHYLRYIILHVESAICISLPLLFNLHLQDRLISCKFSELL